MSSINRYPGIDPRIVASVRHHARRASGKLPGLELEDLEQELMLHAHRRLSSYDPTRADLWTYVDRVLSNFLANLTKAAGAKSRGGGTFTISLDDPSLERGSEALAAAADNGGSRQLSWCEYIHLQQDLHRVLHSLPQHLQDCCHQLTESSVTEAARRSGRARGSIYNRMATLKRAFAAAGLDVYLARPCPTLPAPAR
jgi:DNA-directed RNA polymerase specialized sigma24 family protein